MWHKRAPEISGLRLNLSLPMLYATILLAVSIPLSEFGMSVAQFLLLIFWTFDGADITIHSGNQRPAWRKTVVFIMNTGRNLGEKFRSFFNNPAALVVVSFYLLHVVGLIYTTDWQYALKDLRIKLPLLALPVIFSTSPTFNNKQFKLILIFFVMAVFAGTMASMFVLFTRHVSDPRELSIFISHIRFGLTICFSVFILIYFLIAHPPRSLWVKSIIYLGLAWFLVFLLILESFTGIIITLLLGLVFLIRLVMKIRSVFLRTLIFISIIVGLVAGLFTLKTALEAYTNPTSVDFAKLDSHTQFGVPYIHDTITYGIENGQYVGLYLCETEMRYTWNEISNIPYDSLDQKGQLLKYTLIRFLNSKGLRKDAMALRQLSKEEILNIENGIANAEYLKTFNLKPRLEQMAMGYQNYIRHGDPNASSLMQRVEYWKTSAWIIKQNWLTGVGTGDIKKAFDRAYNEMDSRLEQPFRNRAHNQFLAISISFGLLGFIWFLFTLIYPGIKLGKFNDYLYLVFFVIVFMSMLTEDTLETQAGATFFAFFNAFLLFGRKNHPSG
ncbi:MAG: O-antigen ligase family protein [Lentimicrobium sp.]|nr:O-antigen ligase family protein [Lentimicrobium sp.]